MSPGRLTPIIILAAAVGLTACAPSVYTTENVKAVEDQYLCSTIVAAVTVSKPGTAALVDEAIARGMVRPEMREAVLAGRAEIGMTKQEALCVWHTPSTVNQTITQYGQQEQWVYNRYDALRGPWIQCLYFEGNRLVTIQK